MQGGASIILRVAERHELCPSSEAYSQRRSGSALAITLTGRMDGAVFSRYAKPLSPFITYDGVIFLIPMLSSLHYCTVLRSLKLLKIFDGLGAVLAFLNVRISRDTPRTRRPAFGQLRPSER